MRFRGKHTLITGSSRGIRRGIALRLAVVCVGFASPAFSQPVTISAIAPSEASYGESVTITGKGFGGPNVDLRVGGVPALVVSATGNSATFRVPTGVGVGLTNVTATNPGGHTAAVGFTVSGHVTLRLDEARRVSGIIGAEGGVLTTTRDGVTFSLTIPPGALIRIEAIVLTPVAGMTGFPLERLIGAVHFAPEGLQFARPAVLRITLPASTNTQGLAAFGASGNGENLHLVPFDGADGSITIPVPHFSTNGVGTGSAAAITTVSCLQPTLECSYTNALGQAFISAMNAVCGTSSCTTDDELEAHMAAIQQAWLPAELPLIRTWFTKALDLLNTDGHASDEGLVRAGHQYQAWRGWVNASVCFPLDCDDVPEVAADIGIGDNALGAAYRAAFQRAQASCNDRRVEDLIADVTVLNLFGEGGLPESDDEIVGEFACQMEVTFTGLPPVVHIDDVVVVAVDVGIRLNGTVVPQPGVDLTIQITDGCGTITGQVGASRLITVSTDVTGKAAAEITINTACTGATNATELTARASDVRDGLGQLVAFGRGTKSRAAIETRITITPENATVAPGGTVAYTAQVEGAAANVTWTATGGSITTGPNSSATYTAGTSTGIFSVTATSVDHPTESQTVAVTIASAIHVTVAPASATLGPFQTQQFTATVQSASNPAVTWTATGGTIGSSGLFTAGSAAGTFGVSARSVQDPSKSATASVTITSMFGCYVGTFTDATQITSPVTFANPVCIDRSVFVGSVPGQIYLSLPPGFGYGTGSRCYVPVAANGSISSGFAGCQSGTAPENILVSGSASQSGTLTITVNRTDEGAPPLIGSFNLTRF